MEARTTKTTTKTTTKRTVKALFVCLECGRKFSTAKAAERAVDEGCPKCGGVDIDLAVN